MSLRGAKRRGNPGKAVAIWPIAFPRFSRVLRDCTPRALPRASRSGRHVGLWPPRNDKLGGVAPMNLCQQILPACKALPERRYIFLSRSRRRYRRNRSVRFYRHLVRTGSAFPRLPRPLWGLAMTRQGSAAMGTVRRTESAVLLPLRGRAGHAPPLQGQCGFNGGRCESAVPSRDCHGPFGASQ